MASGSQVSGRTVWTVGLHVLLLLAVLTVLREAAGVIRWILVALLLALAFEPAVRFLEKRGLSRTWAVVCILAVALGLVALLLATLIPMLVDQARALVKAAPGLLERLRESRLFAMADERFDLIKRAQSELGTAAGVAGGTVFRIVGSVVRTAAATVTVLVLATFMLLFGGALFRSLLQWLHPDQRAVVLKVTARVRQSVGGYVAGSLLIAGIGGLVTTLALLVLGVPYFLALGLIMAVLGVVPFVGAAVGGLLVVGTTFLAAGSKSGVIALVIFILYQQAENHLLQPLVQRRTIRMNPLAIALIMLVGTAYAGVLGALLALPFAAAAQLVLQELMARRRASWDERAAES